MEKSLSKSGGLLEERFRSTAELFSDQKLSTLESAKNHQPNRKSVSRSETKDQTYGCHGSYPELTENRFRGVSSLESKLASATPKIYTQVLTLPIEQRQVQNLAQVRPET